MELSYLRPSCSCCSPILSVLDVMDWTPDPIGRLIGQKYIQSRAVQQGANPRGKYHRKPLPWDRNKLSTVDGWREDADEYRRYLWNQQRESKTPTVKRINKPHVLKAVDARIKRHRRFRCNCSWCGEDVRIAQRKEHRESLPVAVNEGRAIAVSDERLPGERTFPEADDDIGLVGEPAFHLDQIVRDEPVYRVRYRATRRKRQPSPTRPIPAGSACSSPGGWDWDFVDRDKDEDYSNSVWSGADTQFVSEVGAMSANGENWELSGSDDW